ncbi:MAG: hypothetical protein Q8906_07150 [Bacillota bacterium]|nr:hypothetical protein [Bacillota bacterium]MDP4170372.1 hypothetical protein [Bacillota bacterium]
MKITTIIELENCEVEKMAEAKLVFAQEQIEQNIIETCVEGFQVGDSDTILSTEEGMEKVFIYLKEQGIIPSKVEDFSFQMPSCERLKKKTYCVEDMPQNVILSFMW